MGAGCGIKFKQYGNTAECCDDGRWSGIAGISEEEWSNKTGLVFWTCTTRDGGGSYETKERMRINSEGQVGIGTTAPSAALDIIGELKVSQDITAFSSSDKRLKTNIKLIANPLEKLKKINGYTFKWSENSEIHSKKGNDVGVIAQEIEQILPEITTTRDTGYKAVQYEKLIPFLIACIKEQQKQIDELKRMK